MTVSDNEINLDCASPSQVLRASQTHPSLLSSAQAEPRQHLFVSGQINSQGRQNHGGISLVAMTNAEMNAVQVQDTPVLEASVVLAKLQIVASGSG
jgi:hypothetical protein